MKGLPAIVSILATGLAGAEDPPLTYLLDPAQWGRLKRIVEPKYPPDALARRKSGVIEIDGTVSGTGVLRDPVFRAVTPDSESFLESIREVVPMWRFAPPLGMDCAPSGQVVTTRVAFEVEGDTPRIFVEHAKLRAPRQGDLVTVTRKHPRYPSGRLRDGVQANVYARLDVDPAGRVTEVKAKAFTSQEDEGTNLEPFEKEVVRALRLWTFKAADAGQAASRPACYEVNFRVRD
ncbi:MAG TPA: hypothetical protein VM051_10250 [Usitatibacter sp.]|nr:hypothetical protein [Usitatibacter sp.]